jgi:hypothetical protein
MFKSENVLPEFVTTRAVYCVWIRADEAPGAPLVSVWMDSETRAFEGRESQEWTLAPDAGPSDDAPGTWPLTTVDVKYSV